MTAPIVLADLDDTLFQTARKCPGGVADGLRLMSRLNDGSPSGYATAQQENLLKWLRVGKLIPVTARSRDALSRADIEQAPAICGNGGCILLDDGEIDPDWHDRLLAKARDAEKVDDVYAMLTGELDSTAFRHWIAAENGMPQFIVIKSNRDGEALADLENKLNKVVPDGWRVHRNDNNLAYLPAWLSKRHAVRYLIDKLRIDAPDAPVIGIGDSVSDVGFMDLCDFAMTPTRSQLWTHVVRDNVWID